MQIANFIKKFLTDYPNQDDYWEIVNKKLTEAMLTQPIPTIHGVEYKLAEVLQSLTVRIDVPPNQKVPYFHTTTVTRTLPSRG